MHRLQRDVRWKSPIKKKKKHHVLSDEWKCAFGNKRTTTHKTFLYPQNRPNPHFYIEDAAEKTTTQNGTE